MKDSKFMRGQIWWMEGYEVHKEGGKRRPALIISNDIINSNMCNENITVVPLTTNTERANMRSNVAITRYNRVTSVAKCAELVTIYKNQLVSYDSMVDEEIMSKIEEAVKFALGMGEVEQPTNEIIPSPIKEETVELKTPVIVTLDDVKQEVKIDKVELMQAEVKRNGKRILWDAETEYLFMKVYVECGIEEAAKKFDMTFKSATTRAYLLRKKYPDFEKLKSGKAAASYAK